MHPTSISWLSCSRQVEKAVDILTVCRMEINCLFRWERGGLEGAAEGGENCGEAVSGGRE